MTLPKKLTSRKLWLALTGAAVTFCNAMWDWGLKTEEVWGIIALFLAYIGVEGAADIKERGGN